jgi:hypothetical protein
VQCRDIPNRMALGKTHCALRVFDPTRGLDVLIELQPVFNGEGNKVNEVYWRSAPGEGANGVSGSRYQPHLWKEVQTPVGMTEHEFDDAVLYSALYGTLARRGREYTQDGRGNSNRFIYDVLKDIGARPPKSAVAGEGSPGLCGGRGTDTGTDCKP